MTTYNLYNPALLWTSKYLGVGLQIIGLSSDFSYSVACTSERCLNAWNVGLLRCRIREVVLYLWLRWKVLQNCLKSDIEKRGCVNYSMICYTVPFICACFLWSVFMWNVCPYMAKYSVGLQASCDTIHCVPLHFQNGGQWSGYARPKQHLHVVFLGIWSYT